MGTPPTSRAPIAGEPAARRGETRPAVGGRGWEWSVEDAARVGEAGAPIEVVEVDALHALASRGRVHEGTLAHVDRDVAGLAAVDAEEEQVAGEELREV